MTDDNQLIGRMNITESQLKHPRDLIFEKGWNQKEAMKFFGISKRTYSRWLSGETKPLPVYWRQANELGGDR
jgi:hypothetical protein